MPMIRMTQMRLVALYYVCYSLVDYEIDESGAVYSLGYDTLYKFKLFSIRSKESDKEVEKVPLTCGNYGGNESISGYSRLI